MKPTRKSLVPALLAALAVSMAAGPAAAVADVNRIVLRVNDRIATLYDYQLRVNERIESLLRAERLSQERRQQLLADAGRATMRDLFEELLLLSRADQLGVTVSNDKLQAALDRSRASFNFSTDEEFEAALRSSGMTMDDFREQLRRNLMMREVMGREVQTRVQLEEEDLRRYYRSNQEQFIESQKLELREAVILDTSGLGTDEMVALGLEIQEALAAGGDLAEIVEPYREAGRTTGVIDLGWVESGDLDPEIEAAVWDLPEGEVSPPVPARGGLHVVQVVGRQEAELKPFADVRDAIEARERDRVFQLEVADYLEELERKAHIVSNPPPEAAGFRVARAERDAEEDEVLAYAAGAPARAPAEAPSEAPAEEPAEQPAEAAPETADEAQPEASSEEAEETSPEAPADPAGDSSEPSTEEP